MILNMKLNDWKPLPPVKPSYRPPKPVAPLALVAAVYDRRILCLEVTCRWMKRRRRGIDPYAYLKDVLTRLPNLTNRQIPEVTPQPGPKRGCKCNGKPQPKRRSRYAMTLTISPSKSLSIGASRVANERLEFLAAIRKGVLSKIERGKRCRMKTSIGNFLAGVVDSLSERVLISRTG